jgi:hypothetical protein
MQDNADASAPCAKRIKLEGVPSSSSSGGSTTPAAAETAAAAHLQASAGPPPAGAGAGGGTCLRRLLCKTIGLKIGVNVAVPADCVAARAELYAKTMGKFVQDLSAADYNKFGYVYAKGRFSGGIGFESRRLLGQFNALTVHPQTLQSTPPYVGSLKLYYTRLVEASQANDHSKEAKVDKAIWDSIAEVLKMQNHAQRTLLVCQLKIV